MKFYGDVVVKKGTKHWVGKVKDLVFTPDREIEDIGEFLKQNIVLVDIHRYASIIGCDLNKKEIDDIRKKMGYSKVWVIDEESPLPNKGGDIPVNSWQKWYFKFIHPMCQKCAKECKQSSRVGLYCNSFVKK